MKTLSPLPLHACVLCMFGLLSAPVFSQTAAAQPVAVVNDTQAAKKWSVYWGWNRGLYSNSDIHFTGVDHDFTLSNVAAVDRTGDVNLDTIVHNHLNPANLSLPQTNLRVAYQWDVDTAIALNLDHMKYVMTPDQLVPISGQIRGVPRSGNQKLYDTWLTYEHTDGLNILSVEVEKQRAMDWFGSQHKAKWFGLAGLGIVLPKSNVSMPVLNRVRNDEFHLAGYDVHAGAGLEVDVYKDLFFRSAYKVGYVNLPDVMTSSQGDKAEQHFTYQELLIAFGLHF